MPPRETPKLTIPPGWIDVTAEVLGKKFAIVGAPEPVSASSEDAAAVASRHPTKENDK
jgi:hypothetical protein